MTGPLIALTVLVLHAGPKASAREPSPAKRPPPVREQVLSCEGGQLYFLDGHYYRLVRGAWVECNPNLPPAV
jgi:hypothetical protein